MRTPALALAVVALAALPARAGGVVLPRMWVSSHAPLQGDRLVIRGTQCKNMGLGNGYGVFLRSGDIIQSLDSTDSGETGDWEARFPTAPLPVGQYVLLATCYRTQYPNDPKYPDENVLLLPRPDAHADAPLTVSDTTVTPGQRITFGGKGFAERGWNVSVFWDSTFVSSMKTQSEETGALTVPDAAPGKHRVLVEGSASSLYEGGEIALRTLVADVTVVAPPAPVVSPTESPTPTPSPTPSPTASPTASPEPAATPTPTVAAPTPVDLVAEAADSGLPLVPIGLGGAGVLALGGAGAFVVRRRRAPAP